MQDLLNLLKHTQEASTSNILVVLHNYRGNVICRRPITTFFVFLSEEQLEEDKLHDSGGKVLSF